MIVSDGAGVLMADAAERESVELTPLSPEAQAEVLDWVPFAPPRNPVDLTAQPLNEPALIDKGFDLLLGQEGFPAIAAFLCCGPVRQRRARSCSTRSRQPRRVTPAISRCR
jgi:acyl-CoA synthetase (NDP forming)